MAVTLVDYDGPVRTPDSLAGYRVKLYGRSTDTKPSDVADGSVFLEMDTARVFMFDAEASVWREQ